MRRRSVSTALTVSTVAVSVALTGCAGVAAGEAASTSPATGSATSSATNDPSSTAATTASGTGTDGATDAPPFVASADPDTAEPQAGSGPTVVTALRVARQDGFDRVVFEVSGTAVPGWDVRYVDEATSDGTGAAIDVGGADQLRVLLVGTDAPYEADVAEVARGGVTGQDTEVVREVWYDATFEDTSLAYVGTDGQAPFRVYALTGPSRVVVEVADPS